VRLLAANSGDAEHLASGTLVLRRRFQLDLGDQSDHAPVAATFDLTS